MIRNRIILLVEDNLDEVELALRAFEINEIANEIVVANDGQEALDYLFAEGSHAARGPAAMPDVVLLDLKLPKLDGHEVLRRIRADDRTSRLPVVVLTSSNEERDIGSDEASHQRLLGHFERNVCRADARGGADICLLQLDHRFSHARAPSDDD
jgi:two-component system response regulator